MSRETRAISPVVSVILTVAIVVILAATVSLVAVGFVEDIQQPAPNIAQSSGDFVPQDGSAGGIVQITHVSGESVSIPDIEIAVEAECSSGTRRGRIRNLPAGSYNAIREADGQIDGENIFDESSLNTIDNNVDGVDDGGALLNAEQYTAGDVIIFRIPLTKCQLTQGSEVSVRIIHIPSGSVIINRELTA